MKDFLSSVFLKIKLGAVGTVFVFKNAAQLQFWKSKLTKIFGKKKVENIRFITELDAKVQDIKEAFHFPAEKLKEIAKESEKKSEGKVDNLIVNNIKLFWKTAMGEKK